MQSGSTGDEGGWLEALRNLVDPPLCEGCLTRSTSRWPVCRACFEALTPPDGATRAEGLAAFRYEGPVARRLVHRFKYGGVMRLAQPFAAALALAWRDAPVPPGALLVPVPLSPEKQRLRGYNQAALLAAALGEAVGAPVLELLLRRSSRESQTRLGQRQRRDNLAGAFASGRATPYLPMVLVDDVRTTGATLKACREVLEKAGHRVVGAATAFYTPRLP